MDGDGNEGVGKGIGNGRMGMGRIPGFSVKIRQVGRMRRSLREANTKYRSLLP